MLIRTEQNILNIARTSSEEHCAVFMTGSGTTANESVLLAIGHLGPLLVISNGEFGERLHNLAVLHHENVDTIRFRWGEAIDIDRVSDALRSNKYSGVAVVHHETSTGMLNPIKKIAQIAHEYGAVIFVDAVSSLGAETFKAKQWDIDVFTSSSGKALGSTPGIGIVGISNSLASSISTFKKKVQYLDLATYIHYAQSFRQTPNTPSVHTIAALNEATDRIVRLGERYEQIVNKRAAYVRNVLTELGLTYFDYGPKTTSKVVTCVKSENGLDVNDLLSYMRNKGVVFYSGKGELNGMIFQIGHIGELSKPTMRYVVRMLTMYSKTHPLTGLMPSFDQATSAVNHTEAPNAAH